MYNDLVASLLDATHLRVVVSVSKTMYKCYDYLSINRIGNLCNGLDIFMVLHCQTDNNIYLLSSEDILRITKNQNNVITLKVTWLCGL